MVVAASSATSWALFKWDRRDLILTRDKPHFVLRFENRKKPV